MRTQLHCVTLAAVLLPATLFSSPAPLLAAAPAQDAKTALAELQSWLAAGPNAKGWEVYLNLGVLEAEIAKAGDADPASIDSLVSKLDGPAPGLELPQFRKLRDALVRWSIDLAVAKAPTLPDAVSSFDGKFAPVTTNQVQADRASLQAAMAKLDRYLSALGSNGAAWKEYLRWKEIDEQLRAASPDARMLLDIGKRFTANNPGLELPVFANVGDSLDRFAHRVAAQDSDVKAQFSAQVRGLADSLRQYIQELADQAKQPPQGDDPRQTTLDSIQELSAGVGSILGWLQTMGQVEPLVSLVRDRYSRPNLFASASSRLVVVGIEQPVDDNGPVRDVILGTDISGTAHTVGRLSAQLVPSTDNAMIETTLVGTVQSRTVGYNGPAAINSAGTTLIRGTKRIVVDAHGFASYPAAAAAKTNTQITGVSAGRGGMVQRIATNRVYESKGEAEQIASQHAAARARHRVDAQANEQLYKSHVNFLEKFRNPLVRQREFPSLMKFSTTADNLFVTALQANRQQLGAPDAPPAVTAENDLAVQLHQSYVNSLANALLSGVTMRQKEVEAQMIEWRGELPEQLKSDDDREWEIQLASSRPLSVRFAADGVQITLRGRRYTAGDMSIPAMDVTADYKAEISGNGSKLVRRGELQIFPAGFVPGKSTLKIKEIGWRDKLRKRFGKIFEPEIKSEGLVLPGRWREAGRLDLKQLQTASGWLVLAWVESGVPAPADKKPDRVARDQR
jgi:hypothetical protein